MTEHMEHQLGSLLREKGLKLVVAESCTGGLIGHRITNVPGSSDYYLGSVTAYAYEAKERLLGISKDDLLRYGAVSGQIAVEMARGVRSVLAPDFGIESLVGLSVTGIAGPGGGMPEKPVGLVWVGVSAVDGEWAWRFLMSGNREQNKNAFASAALDVLKGYLDGTLAEEDYRPGL
jgi:PncC family amidohydrolase